MQTFLPSPDLRESVSFLDNKRLGKQRVETKQILLALGEDVGDHKGNTSSSWANHPATKMWKNNKVALAFYGYLCCREWIARGFKDSLEKQFEEVIKRLTNRTSLLTQSTHIEDNFIGGDSKIEAPWWLGYDKLHRSHRSNLVRKDPSYYRAYFTESGDLPYYWPSEERSVA